VYAIPSTEATSAGIEGERARRQPPDGMTRALAQKTHMKGGITDNGEESQGREEEGWEETVS